MSHTFANRSQQPDEHASRRDAARAGVPPHLWALVRALMALMIGAAIVVQLTASITTANDLGRDVATTVVNFFSFFTVLSNATAAAVLMWAAVWSLTRRPGGREPAGLAVALAAATTFMIITGVVYNVLLRGVELPQGSAPVPWSNEILHLVGPVFMLVDLVLAPPRRQLRWKALWVVLAFPVTWAAYTLVRGPLVVNPATQQPYWYPYPFLDPHGLGGWPAVAGYVVAITVVFVAVGAGVIAWGRRVDRDHRSEP